jgi:hypothetical protein
VRSNFPDGQNETKKKSTFSDNELITLSRSHILLLYCSFTVFNSGLGGIPIKFLHTREINKNKFFKIFLRRRKFSFLWRTQKKLRQAFNRSRPCEVFFDTQIYISRYMRVIRKTCETIHISYMSERKHGKIIFILNRWKQADCD